MLSGQVDPDPIPASSRKGPVFVAVSRSADMEEVEDNPESTVVDIKPVDADNRFEMNLSSLDMEPGETVYIIAFIDNNYADSPALDSGDYIGFYHPPDSIKTAYQLKAGDNDNLDIEITREVFDLEAEIGGTVFCDPDQFDCPGGHEATIVAYAGPINSSDFSSIDPGRVIGYETFANASFPLDYTLSFIPCLPYGQSLPVENVHLIVFLDTDHDGEVNAGDVIGSYADSADDIPRCLTVFDGMLPETDLFPIHLMQTISDSAGADLKISGRVTLPYDGRNTSGRPVVVAVGEADAMSGGGGGFLSLDCFKTIPPGRTSFELDLSGSGLRPGDEVMVTALWDKDYGGCFPDVTPGDMVGFYSDFDSRRFSVSLEEGGNSGLVIDINREVFDFEAEIGGTIHDDNNEFDGDGHQVTIVAYAGRFTSSNFDDLDPDGIIGYKTYSSAAFPLDYTLPILPYGHDVPIENVHLAVFVDTDDDGQIGAGDIIGSHAESAGGSPRCLTVYDGMDPGRNYFPIYLMDEIAASAPEDIIISGSVSLPAGGENTRDEPVLVAVSRADSLGGEVGFSMVDYFEIIPPGETLFELDLSGSGLRPGDEVMVAAAWDRDYSGCFPGLNPGDMVGFHSDVEEMRFTVELPRGYQSGIDIDINREVFDFEAELGGTVFCGEEVDCGPAGRDLTIIAYAEPVNSSDFADIDPDGIIGYETFTDVSLPLDYTLSVLPYGYDVTIEDVHLMAFLDKNDNGRIDSGDIIGYHALDAGSMPAPIAVTDGLTPAAADFDIYMMTAIPPESPEHNISITGNIERPAGYGLDSEPVFIIVSEEQGAGSTVAMDFSSLKYFERLTPAGAVDFDIDLSSTSLEPGDRVSVMALWDKDFNGFPVLTPEPEGDLVGIFMNKQGRTPSLSIELAAGVNPVMPDDTWEFKLNKRYYDHDASLLFQIENFSPILGREFFHPGDQLIVVALTGQGVNEGDGFRNPLFGTNVIDPEYIVGYDIMEVQEDPDYWYGLNIWKIIRDGNWIINPAPLPGERFLGDVYLFAVVDEDGDGLPADGDAVGFYPNLLPLADLLPASFIVRNEADYLDRPVKFWIGSTY
ncbi:MAG: hypothetical protein R6U29_00315 [Desulfosudaceae bacterium]